jgi:hypothetical protein
VSFIGLCDDEDDDNNKRRRRRRRRRTHSFKEIHYNHKRNYFATDLFRLVS